MGEQPIEDDEPAEVPAADASEEPDDEPLDGEGADPYEGRNDVVQEDGSELSDEDGDG